MRLHDVVRAVLVTTACQVSAVPKGLKVICRVKCHTLSLRDSSIAFDIAARAIWRHATDISLIVYNVRGHHHVQVYIIITILHYHLYTRAR